MMFDEMDWRGPCFNSKHAHNTPSTAADHANAVFDLCQTVRKPFEKRTVTIRLLRRMTRFGHGQINIARVITVKDSGPIRHIRKIGDLNSCGIVSKICIPEKP